MIYNLFLADVQCPWGSLEGATQVQVIIITIYHRKDVQVTSSSEDGNTETVQLSKKKKRF